MENVRSIRDIEQAIEYLNTLENWVGSEPWLESAAKELNKCYRQLRKDIRENTNSWTYSQYCERLAYHYYNLACYYNDELFNKHKIDLESVKRYLEKYEQKHGEISWENYSAQITELQNDAKMFLVEVNNIYKQQNNLLTKYSSSNIKKYTKLCTVLGSINQIPLQQNFDKNTKQEIQSIQLLRVINILEDAITTPEYKNTFVTAEQCNSLSQAYQLAGQFLLSMRYKNTAKKLVKKCIDLEANEYDNKKQYIKDIISKEIAEHKSNLIQVEDYIKEEFHKSLSSIDNAYIEKKYIKYCSKFWLTKAIDTLKTVADNKSRDLIREIFSSLDNIQSLSDIPNLFKQSEYYRLLIEHYKLLSKEDENTLISLFKKEFLEQTVAYSEAAEKELHFFEVFLDFLSASQNLQSIIAELELEDFCNNELLFDKFLQKIMDLEINTYGESLKVLQEAAKILQQEEDLFLIDNFKEVISVYIKPVEIQKRKIDNRLVIEVTGKNVVISQILRRLENTLSENSNIEEVRFVGADIIYIDKHFKNEVWHGKNVVIFTKTIEVHDEVIWDISGKDHIDTYNSNAGTGKDGHGKQGKDGYAGESGGNVLIIAEKIKNPEYFTIISNGGKGSKGQDGGNGIDGDDGKGITKAEFDDKFPPVASFLPPRFNIIYKVITSIMQYSPKLKTVWNNGTLGTHEKISIDTDRDIFIEAITNQGNEIIFSFHCGIGLTLCQAFLLYKGSLGQSGGHGGEFGLGGQGGYAGKIIVQVAESSNEEFNIIRNIGKGEQGREGEKGQGGLYGKHGKNGWDMGYMDYSISLIKRWPVYFGTDQNSQLALEFYRHSSSERVWCPYREYQGKRNAYTEITSSIIDNRKEKKYEERKNIRQNNDLQHHAQAVRKKTISQQNILATYSHYFSSIQKTTLQNLRCDLKNTKQRALQAITENHEQQEKQTMELQIKRLVNSTYQGKTKRCNDNISSTTYKETTNVKNSIDNVESFIDKLENSPLSFDDWFMLKDIELSLTQLNRLFLVLKDSFIGINNSPKNTENSKLEDIEKLLIDKYKFATLQEIAKQLPFCQEVTDNLEVTPSKTVRYLIEATQNSNNISDPILGTLNQYLYENDETQRENISKYCKELRNKNNDTLKSSMRVFILEVGQLENVSQDVKKYYNKYEYFFKKQEQGLIVFSESLNKLDDDCCKNESIFTEYAEYIKAKSLSSESYRELLAYVFRINIRLYVKYQDKFFLQYNHNPLFKKIIHVLRKEDEFIQLDIDKNYLRLEKERKKQDGLYAQIFAIIEQFKQIQEFADYLKNLDSNLKNKACPFNNSPFEDEQFFNEKENISKIIEYFPKWEQQQLKERLEKITFQFIGKPGIVYNIFRRFSSEGRHVSFQELCYLINSIIASTIEEREEQNSFCWIVASYPQRNWIDELILLQLENYFKKPLEEKSKWRKYLSKIENKEILLLFTIKLDQSSSISIVCIENILYFLSNIPHETMNLVRLELSEWPYALKEKYWSYRLSQLTKRQNSENLITASYYLLCIENTFSTTLVTEFLEILEKKKQELCPVTLTNILSNFHNETWNLNEEELNTLKSCSIPIWIQRMKQKFTVSEVERDITQLVQLIKGNANFKSTSKAIFNSLPEIENSIKNIRRKKYVIFGKPVNSFTENDIKKWVKKFQNIDKSKQDIGKRYKEMVAIIDRAIDLKRKFKLRDTQKLTVLALLINDCSTLAQVSTGEGKSLIVVAVSIMKALCGEKVDIITSSSVLAKRDAEGNRDIYSLFDINVSHNCSENIEKRKEAYSNNQIVYGDLSNFQRDYLLDKFYGKNILGDRNFENVVVDEVDSMLLDKGNNMLYLSHDLAGLDKLESVYIYIWQWINRPARSHEELSYAFDIKAIREAVLSDLYGLIKIEDIGTLDSELSEQQKSSIWKRLIDYGIVDSQGKLLKESINEDTLDQVLAPELSDYKDRLDYLLKDYIKREKCIHIPNRLRPFVEQHLESWINSAITAFFMKAGQDYVVDVDRSRTSPDLNPNITILDRDTGTDQANSQWDEALHQFLQLKHGCKLSLQSLKAVFLSNVSFFKFYNNLYGLTGTLGSQRERDLLQKMHGVDFVTIPTAKSKQFCEYKAILCTSKNDWIDRIHKEVKGLIDCKERKRSVLIICETVNDVEILHKAFGGKDAKHVHTYTRDYQEFNVTQSNKELEGGQIIIATNLAGRGTDIKITEELRKAGGLHVCLTYLPNNIRIEKQAFGRAARSGDKGSGQLIVLDLKGQEYSNLRILDLRRERDLEEVHRITHIQSYYETQIAMEESCFKKFKEQYEQLDRMLSDSFRDNSILQSLKDQAELKEILLKNCLDRWAFWLDRNSKQIRKVNVKTHQIEKDINTFLNEFLSQLKNLKSETIEDLFAWVEGNSIQMVKLGKYLTKNRKYEHAIRLFDEVIKQEPYFSEAAHYYIAFILVKEDGTRTLKRFKKELREAARLFDERSQFAINAACIIGKIKKNNTQSIIQVDAYEGQQKSLANLYQMFSQSIDDILGSLVTPQSFINHTIKEELAEVLYTEFLEKGVLKRPRVKKNISEKELETICSDYGVPIETLKDFLSKYEKKEINEKAFLKSLKSAVQLPSREVFWKSLVTQEILNEEIKYAVVDNKKLEEIDPSLLDFLFTEVDRKRLKMQTLESDNEQIFLHAERIVQQKNSNNIFVKDDFLQTVGKNKYQILKKKGVVSFNKKARLDQNKIKSASFSSYDSMTLEDFSKVNITKNEAKKILVELVKQKVIEKRNDSTYELKMKFDQIEQLQLRSYHCYEHAVKWLLSLCFTYRIALQKIARHIEEEKSPICLQLITKPHLSLFFDLSKQRIIKPATVTTKPENLKETIEEILRNRSELVKNDTIEDTIKNIVNTLERSRSLLKVLEVPDSNLKPLIEFTGKFANVEELHVFFLNGLDQLLQLEEKKWTLKMLFNTAAVFLMGTTQIIIGTLIELYSVGIMTHVGTAFINEGINDIFFAAGALKSGYFSWEDYKQHKIQSVITTAATAGVGAFFSRGVKMSRFGHKLAGPNFECGKKVAEMSGKELLKTGGALLQKEVIKRITSKTIEGIGFGLANVGIDAIVEKYFRVLCEDIASNILSGIKQEVERHKISTSLEEVYKTLGEEKARRLVNELTHNIFTEENCVKKFMSVANKVASSVMGGISEAMKKRSKTSNKLELPLNVISKVMVWSERSIHIANITVIVECFLNRLDQKIKDSLNNVKATENIETDCEKFKKDMIDQWQSMLREKAGAVISECIVSPILKEGANNLLRYAAKKMQEAYQSYKESGYREYFEERKQKYREELENAREQQQSNASETENHITKKYHEDLLELMKKTSDPNLFASIVRENVQMDMTCVDACTRVVDRILKEQGIVIQGLTIIVTGEGGIKQEFPPVPKGTEATIISLELKDNHFQFCGNGTTENNRNGESNNSCLYESLLKALPQLRSVTPEKFRTDVAKCIEQDPEIKYHIQQGRHKLPVTLGAYGGATHRRRTKVIRDEESSSSDNHDVSFHLTSRLTRFFYWGGVLQRASEITNISRDQVVKSGKSQYQDRSSKQGQKIHAAHVIREGEIHPDIGNYEQYKSGQSSDLFNELINVMGHTQNVPRYANEWHGLGGDIDNYQLQNRKRLDDIDFSRSLTTDDAYKIQSMKKDFIDILDNYINKGNFNDERRRQLQKAKEFLTNTNEKKMFKKGQKGYTGKGTKSYQQKYSKKEKF